ncbi:TFIIH subunit TTDA/Tfb5 [Auriculariales sp. MPI-PUGE-AT-0066]|nr:TFIIH subunit TTDA/Tfb5 [Auriculariales sp. MPI-PUGE-AT-0066]
MKAIKSVLFTCDSAVKQILIMMDERASQGGGYSFIIQDLDDTHLVIKADDEDRVRRELETELERNAYTQDMSKD